MLPAATEVYLGLKLSRRDNWRFNKPLLKDKLIVRELRVDIFEYFRGKDAGEISSSILWDKFKAVLKSFH